MGYPRTFPPAPFFLGCEYIEGDLSFLYVIKGFNAEEQAPKYPDLIRERVNALYDAIRWWYEYGKENLLLNNV